MAFSLWRKVAKFKKKYKCLFAEMGTILTEVWNLCAYRKGGSREADGIVNVFRHVGVSAFSPEQLPLFMSLVSKLMDIEPRSSYEH